MALELVRHFEKKAAEGLTDKIMDFEPDALWKSGTMAFPKDGAEPV